MTSSEGPRNIFKHIPVYIIHFMFCIHKDFFDVSVFDQIHRRNHMYNYRSQWGPLLSFEPCNAVLFISIFPAIRDAGNITGSELFGCFHTEETYFICFIYSERGDKAAMNMGHIVECLSVDDGRICEQLQTWAVQTCHPRLMAHLALAI